jgi:APA family basic amino acid/polyamine antiporter
MTKLERSVGFFALTMYGIGIILGAGIYAIIGKAAGEAGNSLWLSFLVAAFVSILTGLSYMELIPMFPKSAAEYIYVKHSTGNKIIAFVVGWIVLVAGVVSASTVAIGFANYFTSLVGGYIVPVAIGLLIFLSAINLLGISHSTKVNITFSLIEVLGLMIVIFAALPRIGSVNLLEMPLGIGGVLSASALIFFAYIGFEDIANIAEETKDPEKIGPRALLLAIVITTVIYLLVGVSAVSLASYEELAASASPLAFAVSKALGSNAFMLLSVIALFATANTVLVLLLVNSRMMYGMSKDGSLPNPLSRLDKSRKTPWIAVIAVMICTIFFALFENIEVVASIADFSVFVAYAFVNLSVIILRFRQPDEPRRFKVPLSIGRFPLLPFLGLVVISLLAANLEPLIILLGVGITFLAIPVFYLLRKFTSPKRETSSSSKNSM